jgi:hypothetical protein
LSAEALCTSTFCPYCQESKEKPLIYRGFFWPRACCVLERTPSFGCFILLEVMMRGLIVVGISLFCYSAGALAEQPEEPACVESKAKVKLEFRDAPLLEVAEFFSAATCKRFIMASRVKKERVTLLSASPITTEEAYKAFEAALQTSGISVSPEGKFLKIDFNDMRGTSPSSLNASVLELSFLEGKSTALYKLPAPGENRASRLEVRTAEQVMSIEFFWAKEKGVINYEIRRDKGKDEKSSLALFGTIQVPASGKVSLLESPALNLQLNFIP